MNLENRVLKLALSLTAFSVFTAATVFAKPNSYSMYHFILGNLCENEGNLKCAQENYIKSLNCDESPYLQNAIGRILVKDRKLDLALVYFKNSTNLDDEFIDAHKSIASINIMQKDYNDALNEAYFILSRNPNDSLALRYVGESKFNLKDFPEAKKHFKKVISLKDNTLDCMLSYYRLGIINFQENNFNDSINNLKQLLSLVDEDNPNDRLIAYESICFISLSHYSLKDYQNAKDNFMSLNFALEHEENKAIVEYIYNIIKKQKLIDKLKEVTEEENIKTK
ncbi:MAG: hypothetical protein V1815_02305 [Candidatus Woesearchaeota archaeon]